jgi:pimeloyl-ACP methyl ester carboxylesterase
MTGWLDGYWWSSDDVRLHYRDYPGRADRPAILCIPGLTRNARDFAEVAERLAGEWRVICVDLRGRGESGYAKNPASYVPLVYLEDLQRLIAELQLARVVVFGTSLGGLMAMLLGTAAGETLAGALLNDIGPVIEPAGIAHIGSYVGRQQSWPTWLHAANHFRALHGAYFPRYQLADWVALAKRLCRLTPSGRILLDYDMKIAEPFQRSDAGEIDLWPAFDSIAKLPLLILRGALSTILSDATAQAMAQRAADAELLVVPETGHVPTLTEDGCAAAIDRLLARVATGWRPA